MRALVYAILAALALLACGSTVLIRTAHAGEVEGIAPVGSPAATIRPVMIGGKDGGGAAQVAAIETTTNALQVTEGLNTLLDNLQDLAPTASNGVTPVTLLAGAASTRVKLDTVLFDNEDSVTHTVFVLSSGGRVITRFQLVASGAFVLDGRGDWRTDVGEALQFKVDSGGTGNLVFASGSLVRK